MSTEQGNLFGAAHQEQYAEVLEAWASSPTGEKVTDAMVAKWGADLHAALAEDLIETLLTESNWSNSDIDLPSEETLKMFSQIAVKYSLQYASKDLLERLLRSSHWDKENPSEALTAAVRPMRPSELVKRSHLTVAQIFDMARDKFDTVISNHLTKNNQLTGQRRWETSGKNSRHAALNGEVRGPGEFFTYNGEDVVSPRPVGGSPASWSNCGCYLSRQRKDGKWTSL